MAITQIHGRQIKSGTIDRTTLSPAVQAELDALVSGAKLKPDVLGVQIDATIAPVTAAGSRYIITDKSALHAGFGTIAGLQNGDIVQSNGTAFSVITAVASTTQTLLCYSDANDYFYQYDGDNPAVGWVRGLKAGAVVAEAVGFTPLAGTLISGDVQGAIDELVMHDLYFAYESAVQYASHNSPPAAFKIGDVVQGRTILSTDVFAHVDITNYAVDFYAPTAAAPNKVLSRPYALGAVKIFVAYTFDNVLPFLSSGTYFCYRTAVKSLSYSDSKLLSHGGATLADTIAALQTASPSASYVSAQTPVGVMDGTNTVFTLTSSPVNNSQRVELNGQTLYAVDDYTISGAVITMLTPPLATDKLRVSYFK